MINVLAFVWLVISLIKYHATITYGGGGSRDSSAITVINLHIGVQGSITGNKITIFLPPSVQTFSVTHQVSWSVGKSLQANVRKIKMITHLAWSHTSISPYIYYRYNNDRYGIAQSV